jgi:two-component system chemotaxis response regulator CheB
MFINVLIVDNSAVVRTLLTKALNSTDDIAVLAAVRDPIFAMKRIARVKPDVIVLGVEMPNMDGLTFLQKLMEEDPIPVVMCSASMGKDSKNSIRALELGAVDVIAKPPMSDNKKLANLEKQVVDAVRMAAKAKVKKRKKSSKPVTNTPISAPLFTPTPVKLTADVILPRTQANNIIASGHLVAIGISTGGVQALEIVLSELTVSCPGVVVVQHMPPAFTLAFAQRLNTFCLVEVKEAESGDEIKRGRVLIAPGGKHILVALKKNGRPIINIQDGPSVNRHRPSVDVLFRSVSNTMGKKAMGIIMTGMGDDGAIGLKEMKEAGAQTLAQSQDSCVVYGMPAVAVKNGATNEIVALGNIAEKIQSFGMKTIPLPSYTSLKRPG